MSVSHDQAFAFTAPFELFVPHFYLDPYGIITWAYGNAGKLGDAMTLPWVHKNDGTRAQPQDIIADFRRIEQAPKGYAAGWYASGSALRLPEASGRVLFYGRVDEFNGALAREFPGFDGYPDPAQLATFDIVFNCGMGTARKGFPTWHRCVADGNWGGAAANCHRKNPRQNVPQWDPKDEHERRQIAVRDLYLSCVGSVAA